LTPLSSQVDGGFAKLSAVTRVLFVSVANAGRSQLAQALYELRGGEARSGGERPADDLHEAVIEALEEIGVDVSGRRPRALTQDDVDWADLVVDTRQWGLPEPVGLCLEEVRELRADIERRVGELP
jgi:arsenate reductase (thioredoxin)